MPPADSTPDGSSGSFELVHGVKAFNTIPVYEFKSKLTGLTVVIAEIDGPVVNGYFCLATEAFDDDGLPHTLEHLIFLGSEEYPYKGVLDLLANRCLASGTNAWTDVDHTCYTMETAGYEGFLSLMPIYVDHILYPVLSDEAFITEVHHITGAGEDAGVVYCEMQGCENSGESRIHLTMQRIMYPGNCGYSSNTGGIMKNLRESTNNTKVRDFHKQFYRPENLKLIITGQVKPEDVFRVLELIEKKILTKGDRGPFTRPWQNSCPPVEKSDDIIVKYPSDDESNGMVSVSWRGPSAVTELYSLSACTILLKYLTDFSVAPLQKQFIEIEDPFASSVSYNLYENSQSCLYLMFKGVPKDKLLLVKPKLDSVLKQIVEKNDIDMDRIKSIINRQKLEYLSNLEISPHASVAHLLIGHMLYGTSEKDLKQRINPLDDLEKMLSESKSYWVELLNKWFASNFVLSIEGVPSIEEQQKMANEEKARIEEQIEKLTEQGLLNKEEELENAIQFNERPPPDKMLTCVPIPEIKLINFHEVIRYSTDNGNRKHIDLSNTPVFTYFDHLKSNFVYMFVLMDTTNVSSNLRLYIPLFLELILESPIERDGNLVSHEDVIAQLQNDTITVGTQIGLNGVNSGRFSCGIYAHTVSLVLQVEPEKYKRGIIWLRELLYQTKFTCDRLKIIASKMINDVSQAKRSGRGMVRYLMRYLSYISDSNQQANGVLKQQRFLTKLLEQLNSGNSQEIFDSLEKVRSILTNPNDVALYFAANLETLKHNAVTDIDAFLAKDLNIATPMKGLSVTPDWKLLSPQDEGVLSHCVIGMGCLESSEFQQSTPSITDYNDPDMPALLVLAQYLTQAEGPMWKQIRGKGFAYGYSIVLKIHEGLLYLAFSRATNVVGAYKEAKEVVTKHIQTGAWDDTLFDAAKCSLIYELIQTEESIGSIVMHSLQTYFLGVNYEYNRTLLRLIRNVTVDDLNRISAKYFEPLFNPERVKTAIVCDPSKAEEIACGFKQFDIILNVYPSLEDSFLAKSED